MVSRIGPRSGRKWTDLFKPLTRGEAADALGSTRANPTTRKEVDPSLPFQISQGEILTFEGGEIKLNGESVSDLINLDAARARSAGGAAASGEKVKVFADIGQHCHLLESLQEYKDYAYGINARQFPKLSVKIDDLQNRMLGQLQQIYSEQIDGITLRFGDGGLLVNNVNVRALMAMYSLRPTEKARVFLEGIRQKLALILVRHQSNPQVARALGAVQGLYHELSASLTRETIDSIRLPAASSTRSGQPA